MIWRSDEFFDHTTSEGKGESLTITFDDQNFVVISVTRGPLYSGEEYKE